MYKSFVWSHLRFGFGSFRKYLQDTNLLKHFIFIFGIGSLFYINDVDNSLLRRSFTFTSYIPFVAINYNIKLVLDMTTEAKEKSVAFEKDRYVQSMLAYMCVSSHLFLFVQDICLTRLEVRRECGPLNTWSPNIYDTITCSDSNKGPRGVTAQTIK